MEREYTDKGLVSKSYQSIKESNRNYTPNDSLDDFLHQPTKILRTKLEVLVIEMFERFNIKSENLKPLDKERITLSSFIDRFGKWLPSETFREYRDQLFGVQKEIRKEKSEAWRDVVNVMRDFLYTWGIYQESKATSIFLRE